MILFCKQDQTDLNTKTIERKLNHVLDMGHRIIELYRHITCTEHAALLLAMTTAVRQASNNIQNVAVLLRKNLLELWEDILYKEHEKTPSIKDYRNREGMSVMERLAVLREAVGWNA